MTTVRERFNDKFPSASTAPPIVTACNRASDVQRAIDAICNIWREQPKWWRFSIAIKQGELKDYPIGKVVKVTYDSPGLSDGRYLLILGRSGGVRRGVLDLECWG